MWLAAAKSLQSRPTLCDPIDGSPPGSPVPGILQARTLEWVAISFSNAWKWKVKVKLLCRAQLLANPWTAAFQAPPSMGFSRQEYWSGVPLCDLNLSISLTLFLVTLIPFVAASPVGLSLRFSLLHFLFYLPLRSPPVTCDCYSFSLVSPLWTICLYVF